VQPSAQVLALDELHRQEQLPDVFTNLVDGHDVWVRQLGHRLGFSLHPQAALAVVPLLGVDQLDCYLSVELGVVGCEHDAHAALAEPFEDHVAANLRRVRDVGWPASR